MPVCKRCHSRIDRFNKDRCPICGIENPFEGVTSDTVEITTRIDAADIKVDYHPRKKSTFLALFIFLGMFGVPFFYIYKKGLGLIYALVNMALLATTIVVLIFCTPIDNGVAIAIPIILFIFINALIGFYFFNKSNLKDGRGVFLI